MCDGRLLSSHVQNWHSFTDVAQAGRKGFEPVPHLPGIYVLRVSSMGTADPSQVEESYLQSEFMKLRAKLDATSEALFKGLNLGEGWGWTSSAYAQKRLQRLHQLDIRDGTLGCPIIYIGKANNLHRRMTELASFGHTINDPSWALMLAGWSFDLGFQTVTPTPKAEATEEKRLKALYQQHHDGKLPALVEI